MNDWILGPADNVGTNCVLGIVGQDQRDASGNLLAIVGDLFLKNVYSICESALVLLTTIPSGTASLTYLKPLPPFSADRKKMTIPTVSGSDSLRPSTLRIPPLLPDRS